MSVPTKRKKFGSTPISEFSQIPERGEGTPRIGVTQVGPRRLSPRERADRMFRDLTSTQDRNTDR